MRINGNEEVEWSVEGHPRGYLWAVVVGFFAGVLLDVGIYLAGACALGIAREFYSWSVSILRMFFGRLF